MGELYAKAQRERAKKDMSEILTMLDDLKNTPEGENFQISKQQLLARIDEMIKENDKLTSNPPEPKIGWDFSREKAEHVFAENEILRIRPFSVGDERFYFQIREQYRIFNKDHIKEETIISTYWNETQRDSAFFCVIERISDAAKLGYIALKDTSKALWEVAIELDSAHCHQGYGVRAITLFLQKIKALTGKDIFQFLVEVDNIPCQGCMEKISAELSGIYNLAFDNEDDAQSFEDQNLDMITEHIEALAEKLDIPPRKLLSHVLDYRLNLSKKMPFAVAIQEPYTFVSNEVLSAESDKLLADSASDYKRMAE